MALRDKIVELYGMALKLQEMARILREEYEKPEVVFDENEDWDTLLGNYITQKETLDAMKAEFEALNNEFNKKLDEVRELLARARILSAVFPVEGGKIIITPFSFPYYQILKE